MEKETSAVRRSIPLSPEASKLWDDMPNRRGAAMFSEYVDVGMLLAAQRIGKDDVLRLFADGWGPILSILAMPSTATLSDDIKQGILTTVANTLKCEPVIQVVAPTGPSVVSSPVPVNQQQAAVATAESELVSPIDSSITAVPEMDTAAIRPKRKLVTHGKPDFILMQH